MQYKNYRDFNEGFWIVDLIEEIIRTFENRKKSSKGWNNEES